MAHRSRQRDALRPFIAALAVAFIAPLAAPLAASADDAAMADAPATAGIGVARLSVIEGSVAIARGDSNTTVDAVPNAPILGADYVSTGPQSRAEVQFDGRTVVRLAENVQMRFARLDPQDRQLQLADGTIDLRLLRGADGHDEIDTPSISIVPHGSGTYRVTVDENGTTFVTVRNGSVAIQTPQGTNDLGPGSTLVAEGTASDPHIMQRDAIALDNFDQFNDERDRVELDALAQAQYVNPNIDGVADLDAAGNWVDDGTYGHVWVPNDVPAGWAPYRDGNWTWEDGYGWTWVGAEPWGWAPYHYGRWYFSTAYNRWAWYPPGPALVAPAWSPALVGFIGFNIGSVGIGIGFGNVGWVPLAPFEAFHPWWGYRGNRVVYNNITINRNVYVNNTSYNFTHAYRNIQYNGVSSVTAENFRAGRFGTVTAVSRAQLEAAHPVDVRGGLPIVPTANNLRFTAATGRALPPVHTVAFTQHGFAGAAAVAPRTPFAEQQASIARSAHLPLATPERAGAPDRSTFSERSATSDRAPFAGERAGSSYAAPNTSVRGGDPWSRFNAAHGTTPGFSRPEGTTARPESTYSRGDVSPSYSRGQSLPSYSRGEASPSYSRGQSLPSYSRGEASPSYSRGQSLPSYSRGEASPSYSRGEASPSYSRGEASPSYSRGQSLPSYSRGESTPSYNRSSAPSSYARPSGSYARPSGSYARPSGGASYGGGSRPAQSEQRGGNDRNDHGGR